MVSRINKTEYKVHNLFGDISFYKNDVHHRERDLPAEVYASGSKFWWFNGKRHRDNDRPAAIQTNNRLYFFHGKLIGKNNEF